MTLYFYEISHTKLYWLPVVHCLSGCLSICKLFTFSCSPEPLDQFHPNLAQEIFDKDDSIKLNDWYALLQDNLNICTFYSCENFDKITFYKFYRIWHSNFRIYTQWLSDVGIRMQHYQQEIKLSVLFRCRINTSNQCFSSKFHERVSSC